MRRAPFTLGSGVLVLHQTVPDEPVFLAEGPPEETPPRDTGEPPDEEEGAYGQAGAESPCGQLHASTITQAVVHVHPSEVVLEVSNGAGLEETLVTDLAVTDSLDVVVAASGAPDPSSAVVSHSAPVLHVLEGSCDLGARHPLPNIRGIVTAVAVDGEDRIVVQTASPTELLRIQGSPVVSVVTLFSADSTWEDRPVQQFHRATAAGLACASCHPEGGDDGNVWVFQHLQEGSLLTVADTRRTMPLAGSVLARTPYHWDGSLPGPDDLMADTFTNRMAGGVMPPEDVVDLFDWIDRLRPVHANAGRTDDVVARGQVVFAQAGCGTCHSGPAFSDGLLHDVRSDGDELLKTPTLLGVGSRAPLLHDGCAATLEARFQPPCDDGLDLHGTLSNLDDEDLDALTAYVRTL
jgi:hypothetical protein